MPFKTEIMMISFYISKSELSITSKKENVFHRFDNFIKIMCDIRNNVTMTSKNKLVATH